LRFELASLTEGSGAKIHASPKLLHGVYTFTPKGGNNGNKHETTKNQPSQLLVTENKLHDEEEADRDE
jgi:hypothetical protein